MACAREWVCLIALGLAVPGMAGAAGSTDGGYGYFYFDQWRPLPLDTSSIAILGEGEGEGAADLVALPVSGWYRRAAPVDAQSAAGIEALVAAAASDEGLGFASPVFLGDDGGPVIVTPGLMVGFRADVEPQQAQAILAACAAGTVTSADWAGMQGVYRLRSAARNGFEVLAAANGLAALPEVDWAEPDMIFTGHGGLFPNDPGFPSLWGIHNTGQFGGVPDMDMDGPQAWDITTGDPSILVMIIDTGVQQDHPDINQLPGVDTTSQGPGAGGPVNGCDNHGTAVAGCVSAIIDNWVGVAGIAPGCKVVSARTFISDLDCSGSWSSLASWTVNSLDWARAHGMRVTNNSNYYGFQSSAIAVMYQATRDAGIVHFAIAGNFASPNIVYPGSLPSVNAVAALDTDGSLASFSSYGPGLDFAAPGVSIDTTDRTGADGWASGDYVFADGTSFATPYTAGVAALLLSLKPSMSAAAVEQVLQQGCRDLGQPGYDTTYGWGFVNAWNSLRLLDCASTPDCNGNGNDDACDLLFGISQDCNGNELPDECDIASGTSQDFNLNQVPDECDCAGDIDGDGATGPYELAVVLALWGPCGQPGCPGDIVLDANVNIKDLLAVLSLWGPCG